jgi:flagellar basal body rod protein FlgC
MDINTYIEILVLIGVTTTAYINVKRHIKENKKDKQKYKPIVTLCNNNGYVNVETLAKVNPHLNFHIEYKDTLFD